VRGKGEEEGRGAKRRLYCTTEFLPNNHSTRRFAPHTSLFSLPPHLLALSPPRFVKNLAGGDCKTCSTKGEHSSLYPDLKITFNRGHNPDMYFFQDGKKVRRSDSWSEVTAEYYTAVLHN